MIPIPSLQALTGGKVLLAVVLAISAAPLARAETFVTYHFEGVIDSSTSSLVSVGDRFVGTFTYDLDTPDDDDDLELGSYRYSNVNVLPVGMSYSVGAVTHSTAQFFSVLITNDFLFDEDDISISSDNFGGPSVPAHTYGSIFLLDVSGSVLSSDSLPTDLSLTSFSERAFAGGDGIGPVGSTGGLFSGEIDTLRLVVVPEPKSLLLLLSMIGTLAVALPTTLTPVDDSSDPDDGYYLSE